MATSTEATPQATPGGDEEARIHLLRLSQRRLSGPRSRRSTESDFVPSPSRKVPMDNLAKEWVDSKAFEPETRVYLSQRLLPSLMTSLEKLLETVGNREMEEDEETGPDFNPINYLAEQLMRSNPTAFTSSSTSSPTVNQLTSTISSTDTRSSTYAESMKEVSSLLQQLICHHEDDQENKDRIREELKKRKEEREKEQAMRQIERERRKGVVESVVCLWCEQTEGGGRDGGVTINELLQAIQKWLNELKQDPQASTITECMSPLLSQEVDGELVWSQERTCTELLQYCYNLSVDGFTLLTEYLRVCIEQRRLDRIKTNRRKILREVFYMWDKDELNMVARQELLDLLTAYYNTAPPDVREKLSDPENWPLMSDPDKMGWLDDEEEEEEKDGEGGTESQRWSSEVSEDDLQQFLAETQKEEQKEKQENEPKEKEEGDKKTADETEKKVSKEDIEEKVEDKDQEKKEEDDKKEDDKKNEDSEKEADKTPVVEEKLSTEGKKASETVVPTEQPPVGDSKVAPPTRDSSGSLPLLPSGPGGQWNPTHLSLDQFVHVCEMFVGEQNDQSVVQSLATFLTASITNTEHKAMALSDEMKQQALLQLKAHKISALFTLWDSDCAGSLNITELELVISKWSGFSSKAQSAVSAAMASFRASRQLTRAQFTNLFEELSSAMEASEFREFADYLQSSFKSTHEEKVRTKNRQQWLSNIRSCGQTSGLLPALQEVVHVLEKDAKQFGSGKSVSVCVSVLENAAQQQQACLTYKAATESAQDIVLGKKLHKNSAPVSFSVVESGTTVHIPNATQHGKVFYFNSKLRNNNNYHGSLVVAPILTAGGRVLGTISVDSLTRNEKALTAFGPHEFSFIQGVGVCLGEVLCYIAARKKLVSAAETGMTFLQQRCQSVLSCDFYIVKPLADEDSYQLVLARSLVSGQSPGEGGEEGHKVKILSNKHDIYREYLFQCVDSSEPVATELHCLHHLATPLRDASGCAIAVLDITLAQSLGKLSRQHRRDIAKTVRLLSMAFQQMSKLEEGELDDQQSAVALFHSLLLADLNSSLSRVDNRMFAELRSYVEPPIVVMQIVQALLMILHPYHQWTEWADCKQSVTLTLLKTIQRFNPTLSQHHSKMEPIKVILQGISPADVFKHGSLPTKYLYTWVSSCAAVLEHCSPH